MRVQLAVALAALLAACSPKLEVDPDAKVTCASNADCPSGFTCRTSLQRCVSTGTSNDPAPGLVAGSTHVGPVFLAAEGILTVELEATAELAAPPRVLATRGGTALPLEVVSTSGRSYVLTRRFGQGASPEAEGAYAVSADLVGLTGAENLAIALGTVTYDRTPPALTAARVRYLPGPANPLAEADLAAATAGTELRVELDADEPLADAAVQVFATTTPVGLEFLPAASGADATAAFAAFVSAGAAPGAHATTVTLRDAAGNASAALPGPAVVVRQAAPPLTVDQAAVTFVRSPTGNGAAEALGGWNLPAGPYFELAPAATLGGAATLPAGTFSFGGAAPLRRVQVLASQDGAGLLAELAPGAGGAWPRTPLGSDAPRVWVRGLDDAGNASAPVAIRNVEWVGTLRGTVGDAGPHRLETRPAAQATYVDERTVRVGDDAGVAGLDGATLRAEFGIPFAVAGEAAVVPPAREAHAMTYDPSRGVIVMYGGNANEGTLADVWEWDGAWRARPYAGEGPGPLSGHAMVYDSARSVVLAFGGGPGGTASNALWTWNGSAWNRRFTTGPGPSPRRAAAMVDLVDRGEVLLVGGRDASGTPLADAWLWDGRGWRSVVVPPALTARAEHALGYDPALGQVVLFGGKGANGDLADTWLWNGRTWTAWSGAVAPPARSGHAMVYDGDLDAVVMTGGYVNDETQLTYRWTPTGWVALNGPYTGCEPIRRRSIQLAHSPLAHATLLFGGRDLTSGIFAYELRLKSTGWPCPATPPSPPSAVRGPAMACTPVGSGGCYVLGGQAGPGSVDVVGQFYRWDGARWWNVGATSTTSRRDASLVYDPASGGRFFLFGGYLASATNDVARYTEAGGWATLASTSNPGTRDPAAMAWDLGRGRGVLFGGADNRVWEWSGAAWTDRTPATGTLPGARRGPALAYSPARGGVIVAFGGCAGTTALDELWEWDGDAVSATVGAWTRRQPAAGEPWPAARCDARMAYDPDRGVVMLFGGRTGAFPYTYFGDFWEWDGARWRQRTTYGTPPSPRSAFGMGYDTLRRTLVLFGGDAGSGDVVSPWSRGLWEAELDPAKSPAVHADLDLGAGGFDLAALTGLRVRASCGGVWAPRGASDRGATLALWRAYGATLGSGWELVAANAAAVGAPGLLDWSVPASASPAEYLLGAHLPIQCRLPTAGRATGDGEVSLDYLEVRARYAVAP